MTTRQPIGNASAMRLLRLAIAATLAIFLALAIRLTWHWPFVGDAQVLHYVVFLIHHGFVPYLQTFDMNMPGAYLFEGWALAVFGSSNLGWRLYDLFLALAMAAGMITITRRYDGLAGFAAAVLFTLIHFADGPQATGQRDQVIAVLMILSCACLFASVRRRRPWLMLPFALASAMAASIKPTMLPAGLVLLMLASFQLRKSDPPLRHYWFYAIAGSLLAAGVVTASLAKTHATTAFLHTLTRVVPHYGGLQRYAPQQMLARSLPLPVAIFVLLGVMAALFRKTPQRWEEISLLLFAAFGALSYIAQGKGFPQHRYTLLAFLLLWVCCNSHKPLQPHRPRPASPWPLSFAHSFMYAPENSPTPAPIPGRTATQSPFKPTSPTSAPGRCNATSSASTSSTAASPRSITSRSSRAQAPRATSPSFSPAVRPPSTRPARSSGRSYSRAHPPSTF